MGRDRGRRGAQRRTSWDDSDGSSWDDQPDARWDEPGDGLAWDETTGDDSQSRSPDDHALLRYDDQGAQLAARPDGALDPARPVLIAGSGISMGMPFLMRRPRPLFMRLAIVALTVYILVGGLLAVTPLSSGETGESGSAFSVLAGAVVLFSGGPAYHWYVAQPGDEIETVAKRFNATIGGIFELNKMSAGQELAIGQAYKIPTDSTYGEGYQPPSVRPTGGSTTVFGSNWWNSSAGTPPPESPCAPNGGNDPLAYHMNAPLWGASWARGYSWYHNGVDLDDVYGAPIHAMQAGQVIWAGFDATNGFGWSVVINHCNGLSSLYGHMSRIVVHAGQFVQQRDVVGYEGSTGASTGPHLHFSIFEYNQFVNPMNYFKSVYAVEHDGANG